MTLRSHSWTDACPGKAMDLLQDGVVTPSPTGSGLQGPPRTPSAAGPTLTIVTALSVLKPGLCFQCPLWVVGGPLSLSQAHPELKGHACQPCAVKVAVHASCVRVSFLSSAHRSAHGRGILDRRKSWRCDACGGALHGVVHL